MRKLLESAGYCVALFALAVLCKIDHIVLHTECDHQATSVGSY